MKSKTVRNRGSAWSIRAVVKKQGVDVDISGPCGSAGLFLEVKKARRFGEALIQMADEITEADQCKS